MRLALVTTPPSVRSGIGDYTRHLLPYLARKVEIDVYVAPKYAGEALDADYGGGTARSIDELDPRRYDRILYQVGNESNHAFMAAAMKRLGGTVCLHDWVLFDMALAAWPALGRGGAKGTALALREGGPAQCSRYLRNFLDRRRQKRARVEEPDHAALRGELLAGWHAPEPNGRWTCDFGSFRIPVERSVRVDEVVVDFHAAAGRTLTLWQGSGRAAGFTTRPDHGDDAFEVTPDPARDLVFVLRVEPVEVTPEQRAHGDTRRLGAFVKSIRYRVGERWTDLDLSLPQAHPFVPVTLSRDRFDLPLNGTIVRHADAFIVHSEYVGDHIRRERGAQAPVGRVWHGSERRWDERDRRDVRAGLGLEDEWLDAFLLVSFGGVQPHKRIDKLLDALVVARRSAPNLRLALVGKVAGDFFDAADEVRRRHLEDAVRLTGFVSEEDGWEWLRAGDLSVNLRGPTSGGTSGGIFQSFGLGRAVIASDAAEQAELPDPCTVKVPLGASEVESLARTLVDLATDRERRTRLEQNVRRFVEDECHWQRTADAYLEHLESFPPHRSR
ncbi:Glycosyl transferases group 1 [Planctomycetes bacterium Pla163]|uniref:Glycosyl transferases group 1 n=1 Tax=Rohdeia mirabilis TaxID=2528008 RepID=A0A518D3R5_9BACT|nr:Glycosyl transferases group 1 [Planctomycetes bacterium Pla163]